MSDSNATARGLIVVAIATAIGLGFAAIAGQGGLRAEGRTVFLGCGLIAFVVNWLVFLPSATWQTERFYDLTGALTYILVILTAAAFAWPLDLRGQVAVVMVLVWCTRLGLFLFSRISRDGEDRRFRDIKTNPLRFLGAWTLQGLWVLLTAACALAIITTTERRGPDVFLVAGAAVWLLGFWIEVRADAQKRAFRSDPGNRDRFIRSGLWAWSQHPNYFGEITLWTGMAIMAIPVLSGGAWITLISPVFVYLLITRVSGVPLLDQHAEAKWGDDPEYQHYVRTTSKLVPMPPPRATEEPQRDRQEFD